MIGWPRNASTLGCCVELGAESRHPVANTAKLRTANWIRQDENKVKMRDWNACFLIIF